MLHAHILSISLTPSIAHRLHLPTQDHRSSASGSSSSIAHPWPVAWDRFTGGVLLQRQRDRMSCGKATHNSTELIPTVLLWWIAVWFVENGAELIWSVLYLVARVSCERAQPQATRQTHRDRRSACGAGPGAWGTRSRTRQR